MALFNKKRDDGPPPLHQNVNEMRNMGMSNNQIMQSMQRDGYNMSQINSAMNQAEMGPPPGPMQNPAPGMQQPPNMPPPMGGGGGSGPEHIDESSISTAQFEEVAESIIEEKWTDLMKNVNKIIEWKNQVETRISQIEQKFKDLQHNYDELHKAIVGKINDYDQNILNVGSQVKAMEKVFSKVLPTFTETVNELGRITGYVKDEPKKETKKKQDSDDDETEIPHDLLQNL